MKIHRVKPKRKIRLSKVDAAATPGFKGDKAEGEARLARATRQRVRHGWQSWPTG